VVEFDSSTARRKISKEAREMLDLAERLGYALSWASNKQQAIAMRSTFDERKLLLPMTSINAHRLRSLGVQIVRHADPDVVKAQADLIAISDRNRKAGKIPLTFDIATDNDIATKRGGFPVTTSVERAMNAAQLIADEDEAAAEARRAAIVATETTPTPLDVRPLQHRDGDTSVHLVSETPWMVRRGGHEGGAGRMYESHSVIHRVWSDGVEDYRCRFCEYNSDNPRGVAGHASRTKKGHPASTAPPEDLRVNEYVPTEIKRPLSGIRRLTSELIHAFDGIAGWEGMEREELAHTLAEHVYAARPDREPAEPLTPEQIIRRITLMVDAGRLAEMHQQVEATAAALREKEAEAERLSVEAAELAERVETLTSERRALRDLLTTEDDG
jgi:hypothetical protein